MTYPCGDSPCGALQARVTLFVVADSSRRFSGGFTALEVGSAAIGPDVTTAAAAAPGLAVGVPTAAAASGPVGVPGPATALGEGEPTAAATTSVGEGVETTAA